ncbi:proton-conducting transporter membrane subunit [Aminiphilus sp.]|jgi:multicomponent Na+:H+ antiporter subunit D|uniref:proton-conducting transporter transmembrane domain-containing protein n=1 Tax=Aminiphilus sp. TaxID=1872488 RepID=UPI00262F7F9B|nr:proton-conducting transporter membrane subunit [Aminiphilus sp.]
MNWYDHLPALVLAVPLLGAFGAPVLGLSGRYARNAWFVLISACTAALALLLWQKASMNGVFVYVLGAESWKLALPSGMSLPIRIILEVDSFSALMAVIGSIASFAGTLFSLRFMERFSGLDKFVALYFLLTTGMLGMELTGDLFNFFVFLEIASVASFGLVAFWRDRPEAVEAGFKYMLISTVGALFVLLAVGLFYGRYNAVNMAAVGQMLHLGLPEKAALALLVAALAMKCGSVPMHMWTPDAYAEAPAGVTCLLVAVSQASLYGLFRVCFSIYGMSIGSSVVPWTIIVMGLLSMFIGVTMAVIQKDVKRLMAYHSVSQVGYILLGLGVGLLALKDAKAMADYGFTAIQGGIFHLMNYTMYKGLLFLVAGALAYAAKSRNLNELGGLAHAMPHTTFMFIIAAAAIAGLPPFNGFVSKLLIYESTFAVHPFLPVVAMVTSVLTLASFVKVFQTAFLGPRRSRLAEVEEVPGTMLLGMFSLTLVVLGLSLFPTWSMAHIIEPAAKALVDQAGYIRAVMGGGL